MARTVESQMDIFEEGGLMQEGGTVDPVSGNDVPTGSTQEEVRDDIPAQLSEGEFVFPADVVRYIGLENLMELRQKAKAGLAKMEDMGQMGNSEEAIMSDEGDFDSEVDRFIEELDEDMPQEFAVGGLAGMPSVTDPSAQQYAQTTGVSGFLPPGVQAPQVTTPLPSAPQISPEGGGIPTYEVRKYQGPGGEIRNITFINGEPVQPIPEGYTPFDPSAVVEEEKVEEPVAQQDTGGDGGNREQEEQQREQYKSYLNELNLLSSLSPTFKEYAEEKFPGQTKAAQAMVIDPETGAISFPTLSLQDTIAGLVSPEKFSVIAEEIKGLGDNKNAFEKAYDEIGGQLGLDPEDEKYQQKTFFGGSWFNKEAFLEDVKDTAVKGSVIPDPITGEIRVDPAIQNLIAQEKTKPKTETPVEQPAIEQPKIDPVGGVAYDDYNVTPAVTVPTPEVKVDTPEVVATPLGSVYTENGVVKVSTEQGKPAKGITGGFDPTKTVTDRVGAPTAFASDRAKQLEEQVSFTPFINKGRPSRAASVSVSRAAAEALSNAGQNTQQQFALELQKQNERIAREKEQQRKARDAGEGGGDGGGLSRGESPTGSDVAGTPFKQGGLAAPKSKPRRATKSKMKRGGLASKK